MQCRLVAILATAGTGLVPAGLAAWFAVVFLVSGISRSVNRGSRTAAIK